MGLPPASEAADKEAARGWPHAYATTVVARCLLEVAGDETPAAESRVACSPAARIRAAASVAALLAQRMDNFVMR